jgi:hypothetical protein
MSSPLPYCRTNQTSSDVDVIGMITASARHRWTNSSMISRARARACAQGGPDSESEFPPLHGFPSIMRAISGAHKNTGLRLWRCALCHNAANVRFGS